MSQPSTGDTASAVGCDSTRAPHPADIDPAGWLAKLAVLHERLKPWFSSLGSWSTAGAYLVGLLSRTERKNCWQMAEEIGAAVPYAFQHLLGRARWDAEGVRDDVRQYAYEALCDDQDALVLDETGFVKKGIKSVGVKRQYTGTVGKTENCQVGVFMAYVSPKGNALLDRALYLPKEWAEDAPRREAADVPEAVEFATKPMLGKQMLERAFDSGIRPRWVLGDEVYGNDPKLSDWLEQRGQPYVLAVSKTRGVWENRVAKEMQDVAAEMPADRWHVLTAGKGSKGERLYRWACYGAPSRRAGFSQWLLFRQSLDEKQELAYYIVFGPEETSLAALALAAGMRWGIEECFEQAKGEVGLDQYEVRSWVGWHRHITLAMLALAYLAVVRHETSAHEPVIEPAAPARTEDEKGGPTSKRSARSRMAKFKRGRARQDRLLKWARHFASG